MDSGRLVRAQDDWKKISLRQSRCTEIELVTDKRNKNEKETNNWRFAIVLST